MRGTIEDHVTCDLPGKEKKIQLRMPDVLYTEAETLLMSWHMSEDRKRGRSKRGRKIFNFRGFLQSFRPCLWLQNGGEALIFVS